MCGSARGKVPAIADAIERKPLWIDISPRKDVVDHDADRRFVVGPEAHTRVETKKAGLARAERLRESWREARPDVSDSLCQTIGERRVLKSKAFPIGKIYVPAKRRQTLDVEKVREIAESMLQKGQDTPIMVREDGERLVLVEGLHRLEACRSLGEQTVLGYLVQARKH
jgi:hypothetical protein